MSNILKKRERKRVIMKPCIYMITDLLFLYVQQFPKKLNATSDVKYCFANGMKLSSATDY